MVITLTSKRKRNTEIIEFEIPFQDFLKLSAHLFINGVKSVYVLRKDNYICYYAIEGNIITIFKTPEPEKCRDTDYYLLKSTGRGGVEYTCNRGTPTMNEIEKYDIIFVINVTKGTLFDNL